jgi:putative transposase
MPTSVHAPSPPHPARWCTAAYRPARPQSRALLFCLSEEHYESYLHWPGEALAETQCALHANALITNHVHLLLTPKKAEAVPRLIMSVGRRYVQQINRTHGRTGALWDSRYKSSVIHANTYLLICQRYIELNPVRAAMVSDPAHYRWTSYRRNALGVADSRVTAHALFLALGSIDRSRQAAYRALFRSHLDKAAMMTFGWR